MIDAGGISDEHYKRIGRFDPAALAPQNEGRAPKPPASGPSWGARGSAVTWSIRRGRITASSLAAFWRGVRSDSRRRRREGPEPRDERVPVDRVLRGLASRHPVFRDRAFLRCAFTDVFPPGFLPDGVFRDVRLLRRLFGVGVFVRLYLPRMFRRRTAAAMRDDADRRDKEAEQDGVQEVAHEA